MIVRWVKSMFIYARRDSGAPAQYLQCYISMGLVEERKMPGQHGLLCAPFVQPAALAFLHKSRAQQAAPELGVQAVEK
jgi:hypothetical protein